MSGRSHFENISHGAKWSYLAAPVHHQGKLFGRKVTGNTYESRARGRLRMKPAAPQGQAVPLLLWRGAVCVYGMNMSVYFTVSSQPVTGIEAALTGTHSKNRPL